MKIVRDGIISAFIAAYVRTPLRSPITWSM